MDQEEFCELLSVLRPGLNSSSEVHQALENINCIFQDDISSVEAQVYVAMVVDHKLGILSYLSDVSNAETQSEHSSHGNINLSFEILEFLVHNFTLAIEPHAHNIVRWGLGILIQESTLRIPCLKLMKEIVCECPCGKVDLKNAIDKLMEYLEKNKKLSSSLRHAILLLLGDICIFQPEAITHASDWYLATILRYLNEHEVSKYKSNILVEGCFKGLLGYITNFTLPDDKKECIYGHLKTFCCFGDSGDRHTANRAALSVYIKHSAHFSDFISRDSALVNIFSKWIDNNQSSEHKKLGLAALSVTYRQLAATLASLSEDEGKELFNVAREELELLLKKENNSAYCHKKAVLGIAELSSLYIKFGFHIELLNILSKFLGYSEVSSDNETWTISIYVESIAKILAVLENPFIELTHLCRISVLLIERYSKIPSNFRVSAADSLQSSFESLSNGSLQVFNNHVRTVLYQGIIRCCSHQLHVDAVLVEAESYKSFIPLWVHLLTIKSRTGSALVGSVVYDCFVTVFLEILAKLDLTLVPGAVERSDPSLAFEAQSPTDFLIFINIIDLFQDVIHASDHSLIHKWLPSISREVISLSRKSPLVSGFYKVLAKIFEVCSAEFTLEGSTGAEIILDFIKDSVSRVVMFKDDLQISCLRMILLAPACFIEHLLNRLEKIFSAAIRMGSGYPELIQLAVSSLELWLSKFPPESMKPLLENVLPLMSCLLHSPESDQRGFRALSSSKGSLKRRGKVKKRVAAPSERRLLSLQKQFILFLGKLGPDMYSTFTTPAALKAFPSDTSLFYKVPCRDSRPELELGKFIPRLINLALSSADRTTRVTTCELLHSILLIAIERTQKPDADAELLRTLLHTALQLSCDSDKVIRDLFQPLLLQICRYFSGKVQMFSKATAAVVEVLNEGCTHEFDSSLRDFSADCIREFVIWSRKQAAESYCLSPTNVSAVVRKICEFASHPDRTKRLGASVIFNNIYKEIREDTTVMSTYWFQLYHCFMKCLELSDDDETARVVAASIEHIRRPLIEIKHIFLVMADNRRIPTEFRGGTLVDLLLYTFTCCHSLNGYLRKLARSIFSSILQVIRGKPTMKEFLSTYSAPLEIEPNTHDFQSGIALLEYMNWLLDQKVIDEEIIVSPELLSLRSFLLSEVIKPHNFQVESLTCLLVFCRKTAENFRVEDAENLAKLLFKIDIPVVDEFVQLLSRLRLNAPAIHAFNSTLPVIDKEYLRSKLKDLSNTSFFIAFEILNTSFLLKESFAGDDILVLLFDSLFSTFGRRRATSKFIGPSSKEYLKKMFCFAVKCGITFSALFQCLRDTTEVNFEGKVCSKGDVFLITFKDEIVDYLSFVDNTELLGMGKFGINFLTMALERLLEKNSTGNFNTCVYLENWDRIVDVTESDTEILLSLLKLLSSNQQFGSFVAYESPSNWLLSVISSKRRPNPFINLAFDLLPQLSSKMESSNEVLSQSLIAFRRVHSSLFDMGPYTSRSEHVSTIKSIYRGLLLSIMHSGSLVVLRFTVENISAHLNIINPEEIDKVLYNTLNAFPENYILKMADELFRLAVASLVSSETATFIRERLANLLQFSSEKIILEFFGSHIAELYNITMDTSPEANSRVGLRNRTTCVRLLEVLYLKSSQPLRITIQSCQQSLPNLFKNIINKCSSWSLPKKDSQLWRLYNCACVKLLSAMVCQTSQERNYEVLLFKLPIWSCVTDNDRKYDLSMDFTKLPQRKKMLTSIRQVSNINKVPLLYPQSQVLFESSLKEDVTKFDLSNAFVSQAPLSQELSQNGLRTVELELDSLNEHEIVATICGVVEHMIAERITPNGIVPCWLQSFLKFLTNDSKHCNSKLLVLKVIYNLQSHVKHYATQAGPIILKSITSLQLEMPTNYFIMDLISMLLLWDTNFLDSKELVFILIENVITRPNTSRKDIMKYILEVVKNVIEKWKDSIEKKRITVFLLGLTDDKDELATYVSLSVASILLTNRVFEIEKEYVEKLLNWLLSCTRAENKNYPFASEVLGQALNGFQDIPNFASLKGNLIEAIIAINHKKSKDDSDNIVRLYSIHKFYPDISSNEYIATNLEVRFLRDNSSIRQNCLEMLLSHVQRGNDLQEPKYFIVEALKSNVPVVIELSIKILREVYDKIDVSDLNDILEQLVKLANNSDAQVRCRSCEILALTYSKQKNISETLLERCKVALLKRLNDADSQVRNVCETFWYNVKLCNETWEDQLLYILKDMYSPETEADFVVYASSLLLSVAAHSFEFDRAMFDRPLAECSYSDYKVLVSWRARYSSLAPMFAPSVAGELQRLDLDRPIAPSAFHEQIRATARSLLFSPTLSDEPVITATNSQLSGQEIALELDEGVFKKPKIPFRFRKTGNNSTAVFARRAVIARDKAEAEAQDRIKRRENDVRLYRTYRKGDYPDIQIKHSNFILPLAGLVRKDTVLAKELLLQLYSSVTRDDFWNEIGCTFNRILELTSYYDSTLLSFTFELSVEKDLVLDSENVCVAAKSAGLVTLGTLVIERNIIHHLSEGRPSPKRVRITEDETSERWLHLAQLFQELQDSDGQQGVFLDKLQVQGAEYEGIQHEAAFNWVSALKSYEGTLKENVSEVREQFYCQAYLKCLANLGDWTSVNSCILSNLDSKDKLWEDPWRSEVLLPLFLRSELMTSLENNTSEFQTFVRDFSSVSALSSRFPLELTVASWMDENFAKTLTYFNQACLAFLVSWSQINNWDYKRKEDWLINLQLLCGVNDIVEFISAASKESVLFRTVENWSKTTPSTLSDFIVWDAKLALRKKFCTFVEKSMSDSDMDEIKGSLYNSQLMMTEVALNMEHFHMAKKYLKASKRDVADPFWLHCRDATAVLGIKLNQMEPEIKVQKYFEIWQKLELKILNAMDLDDGDLTLSVKIRRTILGVISSISSLIEEQRLDVNLIHFPENKKDLKQCWLSCAEAILQLLEGGQGDLEQRGDMYVSIAKFHRKNMSSTHDVVKAILRGMKYGNKEARQLFGWVLTIQDQEESADIIEECAQVPIWMFLLWRQQLLAYITSGKSNLVKDIVKRIAMEYPRALTYCLRVSLESSEGLANTNFIQEIKNLVLSDPIAEAFINAISKVVVPSLKMKFYLEKVLNNCGSLSLVREGLRNVQTYVLAADNGGAYACLDAYRSKIDDLIESSNLETVKEGIKSLVTGLTKMSETVDLKIKMYSPWLNEFFKTAHSSSLEIPGQYDGDYEPKVLSHVRVAGFKPELLCLRSKRMPFKISIIGDNAREYSFLLKFGEDLRQDERIQQVLKQVQCTLRTRKLTADLKIDSFKVIPLTSSCGLIEWLNGAISLRTLVSSSISLSTIIEAQHKHLTFLGCGESKIRPVQTYLRAFTHVADDRAVTEYQNRVHSFPEYALRSALWRLSTSPEQMVHIRRSFAKSLAVMSIAHWLIGVGDRHEENILISTETGHVVGIDFGIAFGSATEFLIPPELIPFRLTPQILNAFSPLKESGWVKQAMVRTLRVLRENSAVLLAMLEVFVLEPSMDWKQHAEHLAREQGVEELSSDFYPRRKIDSVDRKLKGAHPSSELVADLCTGHMNLSCLPRLMSLVKGKPGRNTRSSFEDSHLSPEHQVECLIDLATDPLILSFTYVGWNPWL